MPCIKANGITMYYNIAGIGAKTAVLVHGAGATSRMWSLQVRDLVKAGYRVVTYDVRGHGATEGSEGPYTVELFAQDLQELLRALKIDEKIYLCGLSMGGLIVQTFALQNPESTKAIILSNTYSWLGYEYLSTRLNIDIDKLKETGATKEFLYGLLSERKSDNWDIAGIIGQASELLFEDELGRNLFFEDQVHIASEEERIKTQAATGSFDSRKEVYKIKCPTLVIGSENDIIVPVEYSQYLHELIRCSELMIFKDTNHVPCIERYQEFNRVIIDFFNNNH